MLHEQYKKLVQDTLSFIKTEYGMGEHSLSTLASSSSKKEEPTPKTPTPNPETQTISIKAPQKTQQSPPPTASIATTLQQSSPAQFKSTAPLSPPPSPIITAHTLQPSSHIESPKEDFFALCQKIAPLWKLSQETPSDARAKEAAYGSQTKDDPHVILLYFEEKNQELEFLKNLSAAITAKLANAELIDAKELEKENKWEKFFHEKKGEFFLATQGFHKTVELKKFYKKRDQNIPNVIQESGIWQGGPTKFLSGESDHCREARHERGQEFCGKTDAAKNRSLNHVRYNSLANKPLFLLPPISAFFQDPSLKKSLWNTLCQRLCK